MGQTTHVTLATATGLVRWALLIHIGAGMVGLVTGFLALFVAKGGRLHRQSGTIFVYAMITMGILASGIAAYEGNTTTVLSGPFTAYFVFTAFAAVRPLHDNWRRMAIALMVIPLSVALLNLGFGTLLISRSVMFRNGIPVPMILFMGVIALLAAIGDWRMIRAGGITGTKRVARHLWRMCFALFIASGSFFFGQIKFLPQPLRKPMLVAIPALAPLALLLYWMWRVRVRGRLPVWTVRRATVARATVHS